MATPSARILFCLACLSFLLGYVHLPSGSITITMATPGEDVPLLPLLIPPPSLHPPHLPRKLLPPKVPTPPLIPPLNPPQITPHEPPLIPQKPGLPPLLPPPELHLPKLTPPDLHPPASPPLVPTFHRGGSSVEKKELELLTKDAESMAANEDIFKLEKKVFDEMIHRQTQTDTLTLTGLDKEAAAGSQTALGAKEISAKGGPFARANEGDGGTSQLHCHQLCAASGGHGALRGAHLCVCELKPDVYKVSEPKFSENKMKAREEGLMLVHVLERRRPQNRRQRRCATFRSKGDLKGLPREGLTDLNGKGLTGLLKLPGKDHLELPTKDLPGKTFETKRKNIFPNLMERYKQRPSEARAAVSDELDSNVQNLGEMEILPEGLNTVNIEPQEQIPELPNDLPF